MLFGPSMHGDCFCAGVITNLSTLEELDLSGNQLKQFGSKEAANLTQLTKLNLAGNQLGSINADEVAKWSNMKLLDLRDNQLRRFYDELIPQIQNGTQVLYNGE